MMIERFTKNQAWMAIAAVALALTGCGSGGSSSGPITVTALPPTVEIKADVQKAIINQPFAINWSSTGATSCTLAGDLTGTVATSGRRDVLYSPGYMEETACTAAINDLQTSNIQCIQKATETDFSLQAIVIQAQLEYIKRLNQNRLIVFANDYFVTVSLTPQTAFPNLGYTIRNKPAEGVVRAWFNK